MTEGTRLVDIEQVNPDNLYGFLDEIHSIGGSDVELRLFTIWCVKQALEAIPRKGYLPLLKKAASYIKGEIPRAAMEKCRQDAQVLWGRTEGGSLDDALATAVLAACTAALSNCRDQALWAQYSSAISHAAFSAAYAIALSTTDNSYENKLAEVRENQTIELRRICYE